MAYSCWPGGDWSNGAADPPSLRFGWLASLCLRTPGTTDRRRQVAVATTGCSEQRSPVQEEVPFQGLRRARPFPGRKCHCNLPGASLGFTATWITFQRSRLE
ncbi:hypothetical protein GCM10009670_21050 [Citricoccus alkalitolerans]